MKLIKTIRIMGLLTVLALIYIHMQMQIFDMAYQGKKKQSEMEILLNQNAVASYEIMKMTSSHNLGLKLLNENSDLKFCAQDNVLEVATTKSVGDKGQGLAQSIPGKGNPLLGFLSLRSEAEARSTEDNRSVASSRP